MRGGVDTENPNLYSSFHVKFNWFVRNGVWGEQGYWDSRGRGGMTGLVKSERLGEFVCFSWMNIPLVCMYWTDSHAIGPLSMIHILPLNLSLIHMPWGLFPLFTCPGTPCLTLVCLIIHVYVILQMSIMC